MSPDDIALVEDLRAQGMAVHWVSLGRLTAQGEEKWHVTPHPPQPDPVAAWPHVATPPVDYSPSPEHISKHAVDSTAAVLEAAARSLDRPCNPHKARVTTKTKTLVASANDPKYKFRMCMFTGELCSQHISP